MTSTAKHEDLPITDRLALIGVTHERDDRSVNDGGHRLYHGGVLIGRYTAHEACALLADSEFADTLEAYDELARWNIAETRGDHLDDVHPMLRLRRGQRFCQTAA